MDVPNRELRRGRGHATRRIVGVPRILVYQVLLYVGLMVRKRSPVLGLVFIPVPGIRKNLGDCTSESRVEVSGQNGHIVVYTMLYDARMVLFRHHKKQCDCRFPVWYVGSVLL